ncbi:MAG: hypothetical protein M1820_010177 [Bogoriella megaspora]|nr:MAG: hypothetical protein M1820_010177 [Bogoriella megaspora]
MTPIKGPLSTLAPVLNILDSIVTVNVKTTSNILTYKVHKGLICDASESFNAQFNNGMIETERQEVTLDEDEDVHGFPIFMTWLYTSGLASTPKALDEVEVEHLCKAFIFSDKRHVAAMQPLLIDTIVRKLADRAANPDKSLIRLVYGQLPAGSPLKNLFASFTAHVTRSQSFISDCKELPTEFLSDVAVGLMEALGSSQLEMAEDWGKKPYSDFLRGPNRPYRDADSDPSNQEKQAISFGTSTSSLYKKKGKKGLKKAKGSIEEELPPPAEALASDEPNADLAPSGFGSSTSLFGSTNHGWGIDRR